MRRRRDTTNEGGRRTLTPGSVAVPNVKLTRQIAEGGMGSVWEGEHLALHTTVAVKFVLAELGENQEAVARFEREATAAARIKSPHVVQVLDHGITKNDGIPYIVMELLEGEDLEARLDREPRLPLDLVAHIVGQSAKALTRAHALGIVHRDIKPSNVFLTDVGGDTFVKLLDFGIARLSMADVGRARVTQTGAMLGTPVFMSPEQMTHAKDVGPAADFWSLGVVAYLALTGRLPFDEETIAGIAMAIERGVFPKATSLLPDLPPNIDKWFLKCFAKNPAARFESAREMADALGRIADLPMPPPSISHQSNPPPAMKAAARRAIVDDETDVEDLDDSVALEDAPTHVENRKARPPTPKASPTSMKAGPTSDRPMEPLMDMGNTGVLPRVTLEEAEKVAKLNAEASASTGTDLERDAPLTRRGPTTVMGVSGPEEETNPGVPQRRSRGWLYAVVTLGLAAIGAAAYFIVYMNGGGGNVDAPSGATPVPTVSSPLAPSAQASAVPPPATSASSRAAPSASASSSAPASASVPVPHAPPPMRSPPPTHSAAPWTPPPPPASPPPPSPPAAPPKPADTALPHSN